MPKLRRVLDPQMKEPFDYEAFIAAVHICPVDDTVMEYLGGDGIWRCEECALVWDFAAIIWYEMIDEVEE